MTEAKIIQPLNEEQKSQGIVDIGTRSVRNKNYRIQYRQKIIDEEQKHVKANKPYCFRCASLDLSDDQARLWRTKGYRTGVSKEEDVKITLELKDYGNLNRFKLIGESPIMENKLMDGMRVQVETGLYKKYKCIKRGCGITVQQPIEVKE